MSFKNIPKALQGEEVATFSDLNLPFTEGVAASYNAVQAENTVSRQREIAGEIIDKNIDTERLTSNGISREDLIDHIQSPHFQGISTRGTQKAVKDTRIGGLSGDAAEAFRKTQELEKKLSSAGIDPQEIYSRYKSQIAEEGSQGERSSLTASIIGGLAGYLNDWRNLATNIVTGGMAGTAMKGASFGAKVGITALEAAVAESLIATQLDTDKKVLAQNIALAGAFGGGLMGAGLGAIKGVKAARKQFNYIFNDSKLTKNVVSRAKEVISKAPEGSKKQAVLDKLDSLDQVGGRIDDALEIDAKIREDIASGNPKPRKLVDKYRVTGSNGVEFTGNTKREAIEVAAKQFYDDPNIPNSEVDRLVTSLDSQEFVGNTSSYRQIFDDIPVSEQKKVRVKRADGTIKEKKATVRPLIFDSLNEAQKKSERFPGSQVISREDGKFALVEESDSISQLPGTRRYASEQDAKNAIKEIAEDSGLSESELNVQELPAFSGKSGEVDYVVGHNVSVRPYKSPEDVGKNIMDGLRIEKFKALSEPSDDVLEETLNKARKIDELPPLERKDVDSTIDQLLADDSIELNFEKDLKQINGFRKRATEVLDDFLKECT